MRASNEKGFTIIEVLVASMLAMFLLIAAFYTLGNIISKAILLEKKVELVDELDRRVDEFMLTGTFDETAMGEIIFSKVASGSNIQEFTASNENFSLEVIKRAYTASTDIISQQLGAYMQRANEIYIAAGATMIDETSGLIAEIDVARADLLSESTAKWSSNTGVLLNLGSTQIVTATPLDDPPFGPGAYITVAPFTSNDITSEGVVWRCTAYGFDNELLPSWCVL